MTVIVHRNLIALELGRLKAVSKGAGELGLVLQAEQAVESLSSRDVDDE